MNDNDFITELPDGTDVPVILLGDEFFVAYDHISHIEFLEYVHRITDQDETYTVDEIEWLYADYIDTSPEHPRIKFCAEENVVEDTFPITLIFRW